MSHLTRFLHLYRFPGLLLVWTLAITFYFLTSPKFTGSEVHFHDKEKVFSPNFFQQGNAPLEKFVVTEYLTVGSIYPVHYQVYPDDILWTITINGHPLVSDLLPINKSLKDSDTLVLTNLKPGVNILVATVENQFASSYLRIYASPWDGVCLTQISFYLLAGALTVLAFKPRLDRHLFLILMVAVAVRLFYFYSTPYFIRAHDEMGHAGYIQYLLHHHTLPDAKQGWETFQPPLYYVILAVLSPFYKNQMNLDNLYAYWQVFSLILSISTLTALLTIFLRLGLHPKKHFYLLVFISLYPALLFQSAQINNDTLFTALSFWAYYLLISFWDKPTFDTWLKISLLLGLVLLTKANGFLLVVIAAGALSLQTEIPLKNKFLYGAILGGSLFLLDGWLEIPKIYQVKQTDFLVGNLHLINPSLKIQNIFSKSFYLNPLELIYSPYIDFDDKSHECFATFFVKTSLFGEWTYPPEFLWPARALMFVTLLLIVISATSTIKILLNFRSERMGLFIISSLGVFLIGHWMFTLFYPYIPSMDFRFSIITLIPFGFLIFKHFAKLSKPSFRGQFYDP